MDANQFDVLIIGAGLSGICAAYHLQSRCPTKRYTILEARNATGGTWDFFRYPGLRSDSDMYTLGYSFKPWTNGKAIADGRAILKYIRETAAEYGIDRNIRFEQHVRRAAWSSPDNAWTVDVECGVGRQINRYRCKFLFMCVGYYDYTDGHRPAFPGQELFKGQLVHPQTWPEDLDCTDKRVVVIGSGATAITLVPELAKKAAHVTMLQRSPTYVVSQPTQDGFESALRRHLPAKVAYRIIRWRNILGGMYFYSLARRKPEKVKRDILNMVRAALGPDYDVAKHFTPRYNPWDQRLCIVPDADLFEALRGGHASVATDTIDTFTETGVKLGSGHELTADIIVTATGLKMQLLSGVEFSIDGAPADLAKTMSYKGVMYGGVPNLACAFGYTNASWTLKCDLAAQYVCRLLKYMDKHGYGSCMPRRPPATVREEPWLSLSSGYVQRALEGFPRQGSKWPWKVYQNYLLDFASLRLSPTNDAVMEFRRPGSLARVPNDGVVPVVGKLSG